jgi:indole-3-glycerol phosphate synthase
MTAYLDAIVAAHRVHADVDTRSVDAVVEQASSLRLSEPIRPFAQALSSVSSQGGIGVISEIKRRSPSKGDLDPTLDPLSVAEEYEAGGASCLSVLTDRQFFGGSPDDLRAARSGCSLPVLRKDFTVSALDVCDARLMGADAVLLIVAALSDTELASFVELAGRLGLAALVEVHDAHELQRALAAGSTLVGVNQRDLRTFEVDRDRAVTLAAMIPPGVVSVAESGIRHAADAARLSDAGYDAVLVGEALVRSGDRRGAVAELLGGRP